MNKLAKPLINKEVCEIKSNDRKDEKKTENTSANDEGCVDFDKLADMVSECFLFNS